MTCKGNLEFGECGYKEWRDGFCKRHHPKYRIEALEKQILKLQDQMENKENELEEQVKIARANGMIEDIP